MSYLLDKRILTILLIISTGFALAQSKDDQQLTDYAKPTGQEKVYLHLDKPIYSVNEDIWFKAYTVEGTFHTPTSLSGALHVELIEPNEKIIQSLLLPIQEGVSVGNFSLPKTLQEGNYRVRAYTNWMRNFDEELFFRKDIPILNSLLPSADSVSYEGRLEQLSISKKNDFDIQFMPEGGDLIDGISTKVAVKAVTKAGKGFQIEGVIQDQNGREITKFTTDQFGHGLSFFKPKKDNQYYAMMNSEKFPLPEVKNLGALIRVRHSYTSEQISISAISQGIDLTGGTIIAHQKGQPLFGLKMENQNSNVLTVNKNQLPVGVINITLFDKNDLPLSERLIFPNTPEAISDIIIDANQSSYENRSEVILHLKAKNDSVHSASISINPSSDIQYTKDEMTIVNYLLLSTEIKGRIESPKRYFNHTNEAYKELDLLMLTQGWSRFTSSKLLAETGNSLDFQPEKGVTIQGQVMDYYKEDQPREASFTYMLPEMGILAFGNTDENGEFFITGNNFVDSAMVVIKAQGFKGKKDKPDKNVKINLNYLPTPETVYPIPPFINLDQGYAKKAKKLNQIAKAFNLDNDAILLEGITIAAKKKTDINAPSQRTPLYQEPSYRITTDSLTVVPRSIFELLRRLPGAQVAGDFPNQTISIRGVSSFSGSQSPLFVIDGVPVNLDFVQSISPLDVEFIDVLKGPDAAIYGTEGANGVILVYTRRGRWETRDNPVPNGILTFMYPGYSKSKEFYSPNYAEPSERHSMPDYRSTIFWEPNIRFTNNEAELSFYTSDQSGAYSIILEGILKNGQPFHEETTITVE
ncbi:MAG: TonB-dependent receptor plug domain-containing protein [Cyclobacteriaceae bacterium]